MTYIDYLNDFNRWLETNDLPCNSQLMYFKLLYIFNRAGWPESVQVDNLRMAILIGAESKERLFVHGISWLRQVLLSFSRAERAVQIAIVLKNSLKM